MSSRRDRTRLFGQREATWLSCSHCHRRFSSDARFCPFDGEPLRPSEPPPGDPLVGTKLGDRYLLEALLGEGGMGTVYRGLHVGLGKRFAIKVMRPAFLHDRDVAARFVQEARAMAALSHPNVVQVSDFGELPDGGAFFAMELLDGSSLAEVLKAEGPFSTERAASIARQVAEGLGAAHAAGIIHRDLKPDNIHMTASGGVKVLDFGVARVLGASRLTRPGMIFGTPHYMSPEQASGEEFDHRADIYAVGVVLYELLTGRVPFEADTFMGVLTQHRFVKPEPPSELRGSASGLEVLERIVLRCLEKEPGQRFGSMGELIEALDAVLSRAPVASREASITMAELPPGSPRPGGWLLVGSLGLVLLSFGMAYWALAPSPPGTSPGQEAVESVPTPAALDESSRREPAKEPVSAPPASVEVRAIAPPPRPRKPSARPPSLASSGPSVPEMPDASLGRSEIIDPWGE